MTVHLEVHATPLLARRVDVAVPPRVIAASIAFDPPLPDDRLAYMRARRRGRGIGTKRGRGVPAACVLERVPATIRRRAVERGGTKGGGLMAVS